MKPLKELTPMDLLEMAAKIDVNALRKLRILNCCPHCGQRSPVRVIAKFLVANCEPCNLRWPAEMHTFPRFGQPSPLGLE